MTEKTSTKKEIFEYKSYLDLLNETKIPKILIYNSSDTFEFDLIVDFYKAYFKKTGEVCENIIFVSEEGDQAKFHSELFNFSMFSTTKFIVIKSGVEFFKPFLTAKSEIYQTFHRSIETFPENIYILIHYDSKEVHAKLLSMFRNRIHLLKSRTMYQNEVRPNLERILKAEKVSMDHDAVDEFIYRIPHTNGAFTKNIQKLKLFLNKKSFTLDDINQVLFNHSGFNVFAFTDLFFENNVHAFFKEYTKLKLDSGMRGHLIGICSRLLDRLDQIRKYKVLMKRLQVSDKESEIFKFLGMNSLSDRAKNFQRMKFKKESMLIHDRVMEYMYNFLLEFNIKLKSSEVGNDLYVYFIQRIEKAFLLMNEK